MKYKISFKEVSYIYDVFIESDGNVNHYANNVNKGDRYTLNSARTILKMLNNNNCLHRKDHKLVPYIYD